MVTILTSFLKNDDVSRWILVSSGWIAALLIGVMTYRLMKDLLAQQAEQVKIHAKSMKDSQQAHRDAIKGLLQSHKELTSQVASLTVEKDSLTNIASYLAQTKGEVTALPRVKPNFDGQERMGE